MTLPDALLAFLFLKISNNSAHHKEFARATLSGLKYDNMKKQLKNIFSELKFFVSDTK